MKGKFFQVMIAAAGALALVSCASGYETFYEPANDATPEAIAKHRAAPPPAIPQLERSSPDTPDRILAAYAKRGYAMIGHSSFNSGRSESEASAVKQGQSVGADLVLLFSPQYTGSITSSVPMTTPTTTTSYTTGSATAYGPAGTVNAYGNATTTTQGSQTTYIPMTVHRSDFGAVYFVKQRFGLGAFYRDLEDSERQELQTNQGVVVLTIVDGTPAFHADILPGDVILAMDGIPVSGYAKFGEMIEGRLGQKVSLSLVRRGTRIEKAVLLNSRGAES